jgi:signal transduction histidine kinase
VRHTVGSAAIDVRVAVTGDDSAVPTALRRELLPTLREAVSNIVRHADARHIVVALVIADTVRLEVRDDGHGIAPGAVDGRGLVNLRSRAARLGGTCRVDSTVDLGTTVIWQAPLS